VPHFSRAFGLTFALALLLAACSSVPPSTPPTAQQTPAAGTPVVVTPVASTLSAAVATGTAAVSVPTEESRDSSDRGKQPTATAKPPATPETKERNTPTPIAQVAADIRITPVVEGVLVPMSLQFAPDGRLFFNEVSKGTVRIVSADGSLQEEPFTQLRVARRTEMGALGLALDPAFSTNHYVYVFYSQAKNDNGDPEDNRVVRFTERDGKATDRTVIIKDLPTGICCHNGGRIGFGKDGK
jgi:glucose/arabinose dehydrogenase